MTGHGRIIGGDLSAGEFEHYQRLEAREREMLRVGDLDIDAIETIEAARYGVGAT